MQPIRPGERNLLTPRRELPSAGYWLQATGYGKTSCQGLAKILAE